MNFYRRRPLALMITICVLASAAVYFLPGVWKLGALVMIAPAAILLIKLLRKKNVRSVCNLAATPFVLICSALLMITLLMSYAYYDVYASKYALADSGQISATVISVESRTQYGAVYGVRITSRDGVRENAKGLLSSEYATSLGVGDVIEAEVSFLPLDEFYSYRDTSALELLSDGYVFACDAPEQIRVIGECMNIRVWFSRLRENFCARLSLYLDYESSALVNALFLGNRADLGKIKRDFTYAGVVHLLALSGLHINIIGVGFERVLKKLGVGTKARYAATLLLVVFYVMLTGVLVSALRAAIMLFLSYAAALIGADNDRITSLFVAVGAIILVNPPAVFDVSLQLSFSATLGVVLMMDPANRACEILARAFKLRFLRRSMTYILGGTIISLGANMFVLPLQCIYFGEASPMCVPATLIMTPLCEAILAIAPILLMCTFLNWSFGIGVVGATVGVLSDICKSTADLLAQRSTLVSLGYPFTVPIIIVCVAVIVWMVIRNCRSWLYAFIPFVAASVIFFIGVRIYDAALYERVSLDFTSHGVNDMILLTSHRSAAVIDIGEGASRTVYTTLEYLDERNITEVDTLMLTRSCLRHTGSIRAFLNQRKIDRILIPSSADKSERYIAEDIVELARKYGTEVIFYGVENGAEILHGAVTVSVPKRVNISRSVRPLKALEFTCGDTVVAYVGASAWENDEVWALVDDARYIIFGRNGPNIKASPKGNVGGDVEVVCIPDETIAVAVAPWLSHYEGALLMSDTISIVVKP